MIHGSFAPFSQPTAKCAGTSAPRFFAKAEMGSVRFQQRKMTWRLLPSAAPIRPASVPLRHIIVYSMRLRSTPTNGFTPCRDALYFASACAIRADSGKIPGATGRGLGIFTSLTHRFQNYIEIRSCSPSVNLVIVSSPSEPSVAPICRCDFCCTLDTPAPKSVDKKYHAPRHNHGQNQITNRQTQNDLCNK